MDQVRRGIYQGKKEKVPEGRRSRRSQKGTFGEKTIIREAYPQGKFLFELGEKTKGAATLREGDPEGG